MNLRVEVDAESVIDQAPIGWLQRGIFFLCGLISLVDGFDTAVIAFAAPAIASTWGVPPEQFGFVFGAGLLGGAFGALMLGSISDLVGRRLVLALSMAVFGATSLGAAFSQSIEALTVWRFLTGIGLGGAVPCLIAIVSEYSPRRLRATMITVIAWGFPLGGAVGAAVSAKLIQLYDWTAIFKLGAVAPLLLLPAVLFLPEGIRTMILKSRPDAEIRAVLGRIAVGHEFPSNAVFVFNPGPVTEARPQEIFSPALRAGSLLMMLFSFSSLLLTYFLANWTPLLLQQAGIKTDVALYYTAFLSFGSLLGSLFFSRLTDRFGIIRVLPAGFLAGGVAVASIGAVIGNEWITPAVMFAVGFLCLGAQLGSFSVPTLFYPPALWAMGAGLMMGIGRIGSFLGPVAGGWLIATGTGTSQLFIVAAVPAVVAAAAAFGVGFFKRRLETAY